MTGPSAIPTDFYESLDTSGLVGRIGDLAEDRFTVVWIGPDDRDAGVILEPEAIAFPEVPKIVSGYIGSCSLLGVLDPRENQPLVYGARFSHYSTPHQGSELTGLPLIDDVLCSGQGYTLEMFKKFCEENRIDVVRSICSETLFRIKPHSESLQNFKPSDVAYIATLMDLLKVSEVKEAIESPDDDSRRMPAIFAHFNSASRGSLERIGAEITGLCEGLMTPSIGGALDTNYTPGVLSPSVANLQYFLNSTTLLAEMGMDIPVVDLRQKL